MDQATGLRCMVDNHDSLGNDHIALGTRTKNNKIQSKIRVISVTSGKGGVGKTSVVANLALALSSEGHLSYAGAVKVLDYPEFYDIEVTRTVLNLLDHQDLLQELFAKAVSDADVHILLGEETELSNFEPCGVVFSRFDSGKHSGTISVLGPCRMRFNQIVPIVRYFGKLLGDVGREW